MTSRAKGSAFNFVGALVLASTVVIRHTSTNPAVLRWADTILPIIGFALLAVGFYFIIKSMKEKQV